MPLVAKCSTPTRAFELLDKRINSWGQELQAVSLSLAHYCKDWTTAVAALVRSRETHVAFQAVMAKRMKKLLRKVRKEDHVVSRMTSELDKTAKKLATVAKLKGQLAPSSGLSSSLSDPYGLGSSLYSSDPSESESEGDAPAARKAALTGKGGTPKGSGKAKPSPGSKSGSQSVKALKKWLKSALPDAPSGSCLGCLYLGRHKNTAGSHDLAKCRLLEKALKKAKSDGFSG